MTLNKNQVDGIEQLMREKEIFEVILVGPDQLDYRSLIIQTVEFGELTVSENGTVFDDNASPGNKILVSL